MCWPQADHALAEQAAGEKAVKEIFPDATIFKPGLLVGSEDRLYNTYTRMAKAFPIFPLIGGGTARRQPCYVRDVANAMVNTLNSKEPIGRTYHLGGPEVVTYAPGRCMWQANVLQGCKGCTWLALVVNWRPDPQAGWSELVVLSRSTPRAAWMGMRGHPCTGRWLRECLMLGRRRTVLCLRMTGWVGLWLLMNGESLLPALPASCAPRVWVVVCVWTKKLLGRADEPAPDAGSSSWWS